MRPVTCIETVEYNLSLLLLLFLIVTRRRLSVQTVGSKENTQFISTLKMESVFSSETLLCTYELTRRYRPEDSTKLHFTR